MKDNIFKCIYCGKAPLQVSSEGENRSYSCASCGVEYKTKFGVPIFIDFSTPYLRQELEGMMEEAGEKGRLDDFAIKEEDSIDFDTLLKQEEKKHFNYYEMIKKNFENILPFLDIKGNERVLEIGCGTHSYPLRNLRQFGCEVWGVDIYLRIKALNGFNLVLADMNRLPFAASSFDIIIVSAALHHTPIPSKTISEVSNVLRKNGVFVVMGEPVWGMFKRFGKPTAIPNRSKLICENEISILKYIYYLKKNDFCIKLYLPGYIEHKITGFSTDGFRFGSIGKIVSVFWKYKVFREVAKKFLLLPTSVIFGMPLTIIAVNNKRGKND